MYGYACHEAENGSEALKTLERKHFDLIITDHEMPVMTGLQLLECLTEKRNRQRPPVIFVTGNLSTNLFNAARRAGVSDFLVKPYTNEELLSSITRILHSQLSELHS